MDIGPHLEKPHGGGDTGRTGADDGDALSLHLRRLSLQAVAEEIGAGDLLLYLIPFYGYLFYVEHAVAVAELLPVAHL